MGHGGQLDFRLAHRPATHLGLVAGGSVQMDFGGAHIHLRLVVSLAESRVVSGRHVNAFLLWLAQGFGVGRIPVAPGTFGSVVGIGWFALLLLTGNLWMFLVGWAVGVAPSG